MTDKALTRRRYYAPTIQPDPVSLDDFEQIDVVEYLRNEGYAVVPNSVLHGSDGEGLVIEPQDLNRINTLALCGQLAAAREELFNLVEAAIGRPIR